MAHTSFAVRPRNRSKNQNSKTCTLFLQEALHGAHGLPHLIGLHPVWEVVDVQALAVLEKLQPPLFLGFDRAGGEFAQLEQADAAMLQRRRC